MASIVDPASDGKTDLPSCPESLTDAAGTYPCLFHGSHDEHLVRIGGQLLTWPNDEDDA